MQIVRRHRRTIMLVFGLFALGAMTFGFLKRIGIDPLGTSEPAEPPGAARPR